MKGTKNWHKMWSKGATQHWNGMKNQNKSNVSSYFSGSSLNESIMVVGIESVQKIVAEADESDFFDISDIYRSLPIWM